MSNANPAVQVNKNKIANILTKIRLPRKFEIFVEEFDEEGGPRGTPAWKPVKVDPTLGGNGGNPVITISSQKEYQEKLNFYRDVGQRFRILREIDPPTESDILKAAKEQGIDVEVEAGEAADANQINNANAAELGNSSQPQNKNETDDKNVKHDCANAKPKIVKIGDMEIKYDGNKVYQKQWVRLTDSELQNYRIVNKQNNKIFPLTNKCIEAKKWVIVEECGDDEDGDTAND